MIEVLRMPLITTGLKKGRVQTDYDLLAKCQQGDERSFYSFYNIYKNDIQKMILHLLGPDDEIDDVIQDVFLQIYKSLNSFKYNSKFSTWLYRLTINTVLQHLRKKYKKGNREVNLDDNDDIYNSIAFNSEATTPEDDLHKKERIKAVYITLNTLAPKKRIVFILHEIQGLQPEEIAKMVGAPVLTVRTRLFYARKEFYKKIVDHPTFKGEKYC